MGKFLWYPIGLTVISALATPLASAQQPVTSSPWSVGLGVVGSPSPYVGVDTQTTAFPLISYEGERFYWRGPMVGYRVLQERGYQFSVYAAVAPEKYDADESDNVAMRRLQDRDFSALAGVSMRFELAAGQLNARLGTDISGKHHGQRAEVNYEYPWQLLERQLVLTPSIGVAWQSDDFNQYYYGISGAESVRSGLPAYQVDSSTQYFVGASLMWRINAHWQTYLSGRWTKLDDTVSDSPMVEDSSELTSVLGISYHF
ncbi:MipA/OmpV family protein [Idiomarina xiamenensis]|uniref:MltA-interacting protein n=1 Tax=Idiomarina xiamenensis 10-D-4 TaxID=740709 RepID=K2KG87_9GAMM|nr:MipA/OmpV family protein [Idiomarina xiamenensis]EKE87018.1 MltA-interacting protein [Idiomarina xiamenensis 10-D-4]